MNTVPVPRRLRLALGPIQYYWTRDAVFRFYAEMAEAPVDVVYLGEVVCSRRQALRFEDWLALGEAIVREGKEVVLSTQVLTEGEGDLKRVRRVVANGRFRVEANDMGAVRMLAGSPGWVAGAHLNIYNARALGLLAGLGATRWVAPLEVSQDIAMQVLGEQPIEAELFAYGRMPLAYSARCFTARRYQLQKESCDFRCLSHPNGLALATRDGEPFLTLNGVQTQSAGIYSLANEVDSLREAGIAILRVSPQAQGTLETLRNLRAVCDGTADAIPATPGQWDGFWRGRPGMERAA